MLPGIDYVMFQSIVNFTLYKQHFWFVYSVKIRACGDIDITWIQWKKSISQLKNEFLKKNMYIPVLNFKHVHMVTLGIDVVDQL